VIALATQQSAAFEEKLKSAKTIGNLESGVKNEHEHEEEEEADVGMAGTSRDVMYRFFDRLVSVAKSEMTQPELVAAARDLYQKYKNLTV
jgi:hypothetical protein